MSLTDSFTYVLVAIIAIFSVIGGIIATLVMLRNRDELKTDESELKKKNSQTSSSKEFGSSFNDSDVIENDKVIQYNNRRFF